MYQLSVEILAYLDITDNVAMKMKAMREDKFQLQPSSFSNTYAVGYESFGNFVADVTNSVDKNYDDVPEDERKAVASSKLRLLVGAAIVNDIRQAVKEQTKYECSAGIAHNKILAKLTCGMNKPNKQTILPIESVSGLFDGLAVNKVKNLGGKLGEEVCEKLSVKTMADLLKFSESELQHHFQPRVGSWLFNMARGIDLGKVTPKFLSKSIAVSKNFRGKNEISSSLTLMFWLKELAKEIVERLEKDSTESNRTAKHLIVTFTQGQPKSDTNNVSSTRTVPLNGNTLNSYTAEQIAAEAFEMIKKNSKQFLKAEGTVMMTLNIKHLGISASKFEDNSVPTTSNNLQSLLKNHKKNDTKKSPSNLNEATPTLSPSLKKFERKSPKMMFAKASTSKFDSKPKEPEFNHLNDELTITQSFAGDFAIKGIKSLKHSISQLFDRVCRALTEDSRRNDRAPTEIHLFYEYNTDQSETKEKKFKVPLERFDGQLIDVDLLVENLLKSDEFLKEGCPLIQLPIVRLKVCPTAFKAGQTWNYVVNCTDKDIEAVEDMADESIDFEEIEKPAPQEDEASTSRVSPSFDFSDDSNDMKMDEMMMNLSEHSDVEMETIEEVEKASDSPEAGNQSYSQYQPKALPNDLMDMLNPKEACRICNKMIGRLDMVAHADHHLALQIATQQREEYRQQLKSNKPSSSSATQGSAKKSQKTKSVTKKPTNSIFKYAVKTDLATDVPDENKVKCAECSKFFPPEEYVCHLDYHFAKKIRDEEMKKSAPASSKSDSIKRKQTGSSQKSAKNVKSVKSYFTTSDS